MSDTPKFTVVDRRKFRADEDSAPGTETTASAETKTASQPAPASSGPRLVERAAPAETAGSVLTETPPEEETLPPVPTDEEVSRLKEDYLHAAERIDDLVRAQNPAAPAPEKIGFEHLVQQLYLSALMQMGAGTPEGQRPRVDILGARQTIDLLSILQEKCKGNLSAEESRSLEVVLFELRATFLELTRMISSQPLPPPPGGAKR